MKRILFFFLPFFFLIICFKAWAQIKERVFVAIEEKKYTKAPNISILKKEFIINSLSDISHKFWLYLPSICESSSNKYPIIYMRAAQNLFVATKSFVGEWRVGETLNKFYKNTGKRFIIVDIEKEGVTKITDTLNMEKLLIALSFPKENMKSQVTIGLQHTESFWSA